MKIILDFILIQLAFFGVGFVFMPFIRDTNGTISALLSLLALFAATAAAAFMGIILDTELFQYIPSTIAQSNKKGFSKF